MDSVNIPNYDQIIQFNQSKGFRVPVFESGSRIGTLHLYRIIKWMNFIQKWDFQLQIKIFITKKHTFFRFGMKLAK